MFYSAEKEKRIYLELQKLHPGRGSNRNLCQYKDVSCVRSCLPHIGGDSHMEDSETVRNLLRSKNTDQESEFRANRLKILLGNHSRQEN